VTSLRGKRFDQTCRGPDIEVEAEVALLLLLLLPPPPPKVRAAMFQLLANREPPTPSARWSRAR
jgi:hypothetical protein